MKISHLIDGTLLDKIWHNRIFKEWFPYSNNTADRMVCKRAFRELKKIWKWTMGDRSL